jgi:YfiH family protein
MMALMTSGRAAHAPTPQGSDWNDEGDRGIWRGRMDAAAIWFTGRRGGVSLPPFASMNLSRHVRDLAPAVTENRRRALSLGGPPGSAVWGQLVHGRHVAWLGPDAEPGAGPVADGLLTDRTDITLAMTFADCVPMWLFHAGRRAGGLVHAGWRGTVANIAGAAVEVLGRHGADAGGIAAVIGPSIGPCCYEVGPEVAEQVDALGLGPGLVDAAHRLNLWEANRRLLVRAGVSPGRVRVTGACTACRPDVLFSHRAGVGRTGRNGGFFRIDP